MNSMVAVFKFVSAKSVFKNSSVGQPALRQRAQLTKVKWP